jgi:hypothetical protein
MRAYIRHPSEFPIELGVPDEPERERERLSDVSIGGLSCHSHSELAEGQRVKIRIPVVKPPFEAEGRVIWCRPDKEKERYRSHLLEQGLELSVEDAAQEWIGKYAARFPR